MIKNKKYRDPFKGMSNLYLKKNILLLMKATLSGVHNDKETENYELRIKTNY